MPLDSSLTWYHTDDRDLPEDHRIPWTLVGSGASIGIDDGLRIEQTTTAQAVYERAMLITEVGTAGARPRPTDAAEMQVEAVRGRAFVAGWGSLVSPIAFGMDDGVQAVAISIGPSLTWIDPYTGAIIRTSVQNYPWLRPHSLRLLKDRSESWKLYVDGEFVDELPYLASALGQRVPGTFFFGHLDAAGTSDAIWEGVECGLNTALPPAWKVDRLRTATLPAPVRRMWNGRWRALVRAVLGVAAGVQQALEDVYDLTTAARRTNESFTFAGDVLPTTVPGWTVVGSSGTISRGRWLVFGVAPVYARADFSATTQDQAEYRARATFRVEDQATTDPQGRVGPYIEVRNGERRVRAELIEVASGQLGWTLVEGPDSGPVTFLGGIVWLVEERNPTKVEVQVLGRGGMGRVLLLVDDMVVDDIPYSDLTDAVTGRQIRIGRTGFAGSATITIELARAETRYSDLNNRPVFLQAVAERLVFAGGCERNDWLDTLMRAHHGLHELRGTVHGTLRELRRLSCSDDTGVVLDQNPAQWFLEISYPEVTPIFLEVDGILRDVHWEIRNGAVLLTLEQIAQIASYYLMPISTLELRYRLHLATPLTTATASGGPGLTTFDVDDPNGFSVDDVIQIRNAANTLVVNSTVAAIVGDTITVPELDNSFVAGAIMRRLLAST